MSSLAFHVIAAYDDAPVAAAALAALLPRSEKSPAPALLVVGVLCVGCVRESPRAPAVVAPPMTVTRGQSHAGAVGVALYACVEQERGNVILAESFESVWKQIRDARAATGDWGTCVQAAALLTCNAGDLWYDVDHYLAKHPTETCKTLIAAVDSSRAARGGEEQRAAARDHEHATDARR